MCKRWWSFEYSFSWIDSQFEAELEFVDVKGLKVSTSSSAGLNLKKEGQKGKVWDQFWDVAPPSWTLVRDQTPFISTHQKTLQAWHIETQIMCNN